MATAPRATTETLLGIALTARQRRLLDLTELAGRLDRVGRMPGRRKVERVLAALVRDGSDSVFESRVRDRLRAAGLRPTDGPLPVPVADGRTVHLDIAFPDAKVAIECQGHVAHHTPKQLGRDARRDNVIALARDWLVLKLTWDRFINDWDGFLTELHMALDARQTWGANRPHG